jgi:hypothetical protein
MTSIHRLEVWIAAFFTLIFTASSILLIGWRTRPPIVLQGAVTVQSSDPRKERPISDVDVSVAGDLATATARSDSSGSFSVPLRRSVRRGDAITLLFHHPQYADLKLNDFVGDKLYVVHMIPLSNEAPASRHPDIKVGNVRVRYSVKAQTELNVGSAAKAFQIENQGNIPCKKQRPCSPDGKWKAALGSASLDAGPGNEFRNARASCIAGPCPFTKIESDKFTQGGRTIMVSVRDWSDTATFLLEAEVFHPMVSQIVHESYPVIFGDGLNFTLPANADGVSLEADFDGQTVIFPLGPTNALSWAECNARANPDQTRVYRCQLKPGYQFQQSQEGSAQN